MTIRQNILLFGLIIVANLVFLNSCGGCKKETEQQKLIKEENKLIEEISSKANLTKENKEGFKKKIQDFKKEENEKEKLNTLIRGFEEAKEYLASNLAANSAQLNQLTPQEKKQLELVVLPNFNKQMQKGLSGANFKDILEIEPTLSLAIQLLQNIEKQIDLKTKPKK